MYLHNIYIRELILASKICIGHCKSCLPRYIIVGTIHSLKRNGPCWHFGPPAFVGICTPIISILSATFQSVRAWCAPHVQNLKRPDGTNLACLGCYFPDQAEQAPFPPLHCPGRGRVAPQCKEISRWNSEISRMDLVSAKSRACLRVFEDSSTSHHQGLARPPSSRKNWREGEPRTTVCWLVCHIVTYLININIYKYIYIY